MDSVSPPRKKLKQARLPFQILSHSSPDTSVSSATRKRQLSEESKDDVVASKVKKSEEYKENTTILSPPKVSVDVVNGTANEVITADELKNEDSHEDKRNSPLDGSKTSQSQDTCSILQGQMKSTLANLFERKSFDVTADVGSCDCGCEDADSEEEAMKEYFEHSRKEKHDPSEKKPKGRVRKKPATKSKAKEQSPKVKENNVMLDKSETNDGSNPVPAETEKDDTKNGDLPESSGVAKSNPLEKSGLLSKKAIEMFAKWKKGGDDLVPEKSTKPANETKREQDLKLLNGSDLKLKSEQKSVASHKNFKGSKSTDRALTDSNDLKCAILEEAKNNEQDDRKDDLKVESRTSKSGSPEVCNLKTDEKDAEKDGSPPKKNLKQGIQSISDNSSDHSKSSADEMLQSTDGGSIVSSKILSGAELKESADLDLDKMACPLTPTNLSKTPQRRLTPKQVERQKEIARKQEEKEKQKLERELEKKRLKQEKDELKKKEREEKDEQRRKEKEEKEKKKQAEQEQKNEGKKKRELQKAEEKRRKEEEKKKLDEEEERKKAKASAMFTSFFVPKSSKSERDEAPEPVSTVQNFMPFEVKADMQMAPRVRVRLNSPQKQYLDETIGSDCCKPQSELYIKILKSGQVIPKVDKKTWPVDETKEDDDVCVLESDDSGVLISGSKKIEKIKAKFLQFCENHRPAYRGTWRKKSTVVTGRRPFGQEKILDYEVDSADEWEEEEPGESLHGSDDEKEQESEDEYEVDNSIFVPHGYLSDDEGDDENEEVLSPETQKAKLKLLGEEFEAQMKSKTSALKPMIIVLTAALQASSLGSARYQKLFERRAVWQEDEGPIVLPQIGNDTDNADGQASLNSDSSCMTIGSGPRAKKKIISEEAIPALITLVHGNQNKRVFLTNEFSAFLGKSQLVQSENTNENTDSNGLLDRPGTPSSVRNPMAIKWPGLPPASRMSISNKIKELATWGVCPEEVHNRQCWYVAEEVRETYGLKDLKIPNTQWHYTLKPKVLNHINSPNATAHSSSTSGTDSRALITKFTKVMTPEEKQRQWESMKSAASNTPSSSKLVSSKGSTGKITAFTQQVKTPSSSAPDCNQISPAVAVGICSNTPTSSQPQAKKRVPLLVSVPRGHQISSSSHCSLLSKFEASASKSSVPASSAKPKVDNDIVVLD